jgi:fructose-specific PTS system IIA-like component
MSLVLEFECVLPNGVHARPASLIKEQCKGFEADIRWRNMRTGAVANAKSVVALIGSDTLFHDSCEIAIDGPDQDAAYACLARFIRNEFPHCDGALAPVATAVDALPPLPRCLANLDPVVLRAPSVCEGVAQGTLVAIGGFDFDAMPELPPPLLPAQERGRLDGALAELTTALRAQHHLARGSAAEVLAAHASIVSDPEFAQQLHLQLEACGACAPAIAATARHFRDTLLKSRSELMRERELDMRDVCFQLLQQIYGSEHFRGGVQLTADAICLAEHMTPSQFIELDKRHLKGLLLAHGGSTSHTVILARSFNIPTLVAVDYAALAAKVGSEVIVDGDVGLVAVDISEAVARYYRQEMAVKQAFAERVAAFNELGGCTRDGLRIEVAANIALPVEAGAAFARGAESIGLFRTEMMYMDRKSAPDEDELYALYCQTLAAAAGRSVIVRTMDIGGDKPLDYLAIPAEANPFLGYRAVRIYAEFIELFKQQLRSILRASAHGPLKIMIPMISSLDEILWVKEILAEVKRELREQHVLFDEKVPLGIMLEVPSIAFIIDQCCEEIDFFSIGSNDLTQYLLAVDRENSRVSRHYNSLNPAFLRALDHVVAQVHRHGKWIGLCGELGAKGSVLPLLVGLGLDEISMSAPGIAATKERMARLDSRECRQLLNRALACRTALEVEDLLARFRMAQQDAPLVSADFVALDVDYRSKEEAIKALTDRLFLAGRCRYPGRLADDVWAREDVFSTGLGFGFAIPHTKSEHVEQSTISVARLAHPIQWGEESARFIIMLTLNKHAAGDQHMKIFSRLARRIMNEGFRQQLMQSATSQDVEALLLRELEI